ncbi:hypothetical protein CEXT_792621 [Caerostris extrusa]|uniref:Uncharacterized protein n=1 Tax=Caerostris extrusa TaxID=172846 RepID=A0AAV4MAZ2_CAEEX|nr:hypothetical protein CEXT_792621 [Caerostris extrusa]
MELMAIFRFSLYEVSRLGRSVSKACPNAYHPHPHHPPTSFLGGWGKLRSKWTFIILLFPQLVRPLTGRRQGRDIFADDTVS